MNYKSVNMYMDIETYNDASVFSCGTHQTWNVHLVIVESLQVQTQLAHSKSEHNTWFNLAMEL